MVQRDQLLILSLEVLARIPKRRDFFSQDFREKENVENWFRHRIHVGETKMAAIMNLLIGREIFKGKRSGGRAILILPI